MFWPKRNSSEQVIPLHDERPHGGNALPENFSVPEVREGNGDADWALWERCSAEVEELARIQNRRKRAGAGREHAA